MCGRVDQRLDPPFTDKEGFCLLGQSSRWEGAWLKRRMKREGQGGREANKEGQSDQGLKMGGKGQSKGE